MKKLRHSQYVHNINYSFIIIIVVITTAGLSNL